MWRPFFALIVSLLSWGVFCIDKYSREDFPPGFIFGAGTSAYQAEGAANEDGRGPSVWDTFVREGNLDGATGDVAVDQYHKYKEDVQHMVETAMDAYRFSISWTRLIPNGRGAVNPKGLLYYNNLINELLSQGIQPHATLCHYDHPQALEDEYGGWVSRKIIRDFMAYADVCFREFGDRISYWSTINEPNVFVLGGYDVGFTPPKRCSPPFGSNCPTGNSSYEPYLAAHHMLLAHASTVRLYKKKYQDKQHGFIGLTLFIYGFVPLTNSTIDAIATERANDFYIGWFVEPLVFGEYPETIKKIAGSRIPVFTIHESRMVKGSFDFIGINYYNTYYIKDNSDSWKLEQRDVLTDMAVEMLIDRDNIIPNEFPTRPWGLQAILEYIKQAYGNPPVYIHENGLSSSILANVLMYTHAQSFTGLHEICHALGKFLHGHQCQAFVGQMTRRNSSLEDTSRVKFLHAHIGSVLDSIRNGSNVRGYFVWSLLDVLELLGGYETGFGLYFVDLDDPDLRRYPKLSANWYSLFLKGNKVSMDGITELQKKFSVALASVANV